MRKQIVAGNWKMHTSLQEGSALATSINKMVKNEVENKETGVVIAPPHTHLSVVNQLINTERICLAAQNCASEAKGAFTGEVSAKMLSTFGVKAVILGHSERRAYYGETNETLMKKVNLVIENNMKPIFCCGEKLEEREAGNYFDVVKEQIENVVFNLSKEDFEKVIIAYEPVWAIGTGKTASSDQAQEMHAYIRKLIVEKFGNDIADNTTILYGGSCKPSNAVELFSKPDVDGGLIGGASLKAEDFIGIINSFN
ncbi:MAG: triose-phosphate isomerase [Bacteroidetes bacterium 4572_117]|nr:MAG: triose-phosphate isomerase [Bacteroidetes bacterium 4572_117]